MNDDRKILKKLSKKLEQKADMGGELDPNKPILSIPGAVVLAKEDHFFISMSAALTSTEAVIVFKGINDMFNKIIKKEDRLNKELNITDCHVHVQREDGKYTTLFGDSAQQYVDLSKAKQTYHQLEESKNKEKEQETVIEKQPEGIHLPDGSIYNGDRN